MDAPAQDALISGLLAPTLAPGLQVTAREHALLRYAEKLTRAPSSILAADIDALRHEGLDDRAIHDACAIISYFAFVNRIADGLGVELEPPAPSSIAPP